MHRFYANISHNTPKQDDITKTLLISTQSQHAHNIRAIFVGKTPPTTLTTGIPRLQWKTVSAENNNPATLIIIDNAVIYPTIADSWDKSSWLVLQSTSIQSAQVSMFEALWAQTAEPTSPSKPQPRTPNRPKPSPKGPAGLTKLPGFMRK
ncbi:MAG: hypothetical protein A3F54_00900 [Candidatus Kerfeldbacteria bacterium RIFCSPHIGHO2_12_FULL_48_17]|uniref:Uncharacterized protein n=1 Tax=Candidatus Kerfeldbacteria bacterium RIFCSPHIGHO2_12_FULL_48_17 TaxID=1798542 RepID=A0A1G2B4H7_9BACT|nr:MAG: hypothetical protein A3F54_00900 [Candidatus Kerfeldbacteria bacterium RIFCSPHIGHO2_12_FULL_48_17]